ncbi:sensor histidine kinase [Fulvivirga lutea]|uniref:Histidine kinase n=1 Tax=Fulvivirga lutea TaxID=2810512 RepID=A0A974WDE6_9BACT|nr:histidine kinase [Fulvivirga lutea]QSE95968.1 histidine kinase [Fulvivirga lutea]
MKKFYYILIIVTCLVAIIGGYLYYTDAPLDVYYTIGWMLAVLALLIGGNGLISYLFDKKLPWLRFGARRLIAHLFLGVIYSLIIINVAYLAFKLLLTNEPPTDVQLAVTNAYGIVIFIPLFSIYFSFHFLKSWQKSELQTEQFKKETLKFQLDNLKSHLDPHFLFNNLNILSSLIDYSPKESKVFLDKFVDVYRSILKTKDEDLIELRDEMEVIDSYIYLLKTRFEENVQFELNVQKTALSKMLPPLTIQMLLENAIKHNVISEKRPLRISIKSEDDYLIVNNTLHLKPKELVDENGSGIENIKKRYSHFTNSEVIADKTETEFTVKVPLLELETI